LTFASDIRAYVMHQANRRIIDATLDSTGFSPSQAFVNVEHYGNTAAATIPIAMSELLKRGRAAGWRLAVEYELRCWVHLGGSLDSVLIGTDQDGASQSPNQTDLFTLLIQTPRRALARASTKPFRNSVTTNRTGAYLSTRIGSSYRAPRKFRRPPMVSRTKLALVTAIVVSLLTVPIAARGRATLTLENGSRDDALVRVIGPTSGFVDVPSASSRTVYVSGGAYRIFVRYGQSGSYIYTRGEPFSIKDDHQGWEEVTITLHKVPNGNYRTTLVTKASSTAHADIVRTIVPNGR
jgi:hypothetical protein